MICVSGGFDPLHIGHLRMMQAAALYGPVTVILNSDAWLVRKKGYVLMPWNDRAEIIRAIRCVADVVAVDDSDGTVCEALTRLKPDCFGNGGDRTNTNTPELAVCARLSIMPVFGLGGEKVASSSELIRRAFVEAMSD
jgi:cytidyltransferase-like protein